MQATDTNLQSGYRRDIDGMRAIAVLAVVMFHLFPTHLTGGFAGVDVFFVISGFLITSLLIQPSQRPFRGELLHFYRKRVHRIFPALIGTLAFCACFGWFCLLTVEFRELSANIGAGVGFVANLVLWHQSGYFESAAVKKPLLHLWSLGIEEQFYIVLPCLVALTRHRLLLLRILLLVLTVGSFAWCVHLSTVDPSAAFYSPVSRGFELLSGSLLACWPTTDAASRPLQELMAMAGVGLLVSAFICFNPNMTFPGWMALLPLIGAALVLCAPRAWLNRRVLGMPALTAIGLISYPLYLWHWPLISFYHVIEGRPGRWAAVAILSLAFLLAVGTHLLVEKRWRHDFRRRATATLLASMALLLAGGMLGFSSVIEPRHADPELEKITTAIGEWEYPPTDFRLYRYDGQAFYLNSAGPSRTLFIGDSHVEQYAARTSEVLQRSPSGYRSALFATGSGCAPVVGLSEPARSRCSGIVSAAYALARSQEVDRVVVGACWWCYFVDAARPDSAVHYRLMTPGGSGAVSLQSQQGPRALMHALEDQLRALSRLKKVYLLLDNPNSPMFDPQNFISGSRLTTLRYHPPSGPYSLGKDPGFSEVRNELTAMARRLNIQIIDPVDHLCRQGACPCVEEDGTPIYKDRGHLRPKFVRRHADFLDVALAP